jgi:hypothetical protein
MASLRVSSIASLALGACWLLGGCTGAPDRPATVPVRGSVSYQGKPVAGAAVAFLAKGAPRPAIGTTDAQGNFRLTTFTADDGAVPGEHLVTVEKFSAD